MQWLQHKAKVWKVVDYASPFFMSVTKIVNSWKRDFVQHGVKDELVADYIEYLKPLVKKGVPVIFDFKHLCLLLGKNTFYLASLINANVSHYREFVIPKRRGGQRIISAPYPTLLDCQQWIYQHILSKVPIHPSAHGFAARKSIITNAQVHVGKKYFLKIDIKDFFPSITINQVITVFKNLGYTHKVSFYLASICCYEKVLPQGAPTSPMLSNIIANSMDNRLARLARKFKLSYTRYADDLAFSGNSITVKHLHYITGIIQECGFTVNPSKTILQQKKNKRILTGISIAEGKIKIPREYKRKLKMEIHCIRKYGIVMHIRNQRIKNPNHLSTIIGRIQFWLSVEPENDFAKKALAELNRLPH
jgi:retron-type reverse transcriptase